MDKISIIIPVYNMEPYIRQCLDSVINQTYTNLEILVINDGSTDNCGIICDEYARKDNRIRVFHKANGGLSSALNVGLENFTGMYLGFTDPDDWIEPDMYEVLYRELRKNKVTLCAANYYRDYYDCSEIARGREKIPSSVLTQKEMLLYISRRYHYNGFRLYVWNKLFTSAIVRENSLVFNENIRMGMDGVFTASVIFTDNCTGYYVDKPLYHYFQRPDSIVNSKLTVNEVDMVSALKEIVEIAEKKGFHEGTIWLKREICYNASLIAEKALEENESELFFTMQNEIKMFIGEYTATNSEYPERIERMNKLCDAVIGK